MAFPKLEETAVLTINGADYSDWESVMVKHEIDTNPWIHFRFTCSEGMPLAKNWAAMRIVPGMECTVTLAGHPAVSGLVCSRQVLVDARRHYIEIQGASTTIQLAAAAVTHQTFEFNNVDYKTFAKQLIKPWPSMQFLERGGSIPSTKFERIAIPPGSTVLDALDLSLRSIGHARLTSNPQGDLVAVMGPSEGSDTVYEGDLGRPSYIEGREIIYNVGLAKGLNEIGLRPGNDQTWGAKATHLNYLGNSISGYAGKYAPQIIPLESPVWAQEHLKGRSDMEAGLQGSDEVTVFVTVNGWLRPRGGLWEPYQSVDVISPMLVMKGTEDLRLKSVTFNQDNQTGTTSVLELQNPAALAGGVPQE